MKQPWKHIFFVLLVLYLSPHACLRGQAPSVIELQKELAMADNAIDSITLLNELAWHYQTQVDSALPYALKALTLSEQRGYTVGLGDSYSRLGTLAYYAEDYEMAYFLFQNSLVIREEISAASDLVASAYNNMGNALNGRGYHDSALVNFQAAIEIYLRLLPKNPEVGKTLISTYLSMTSSLTAEISPQTAIDTLDRLFEPDLIESIPSFSRQIYQSYGLAFQIMGQVDSAYLYYQLCLNEAIKGGATAEEKAEILNQMGLTAVKAKDFAGALSSYYEPATRLLDLKEPSRVSVNLLQNMGIAHDSLGNIQQALNLYRSYQQMEKELLSMNQLQSLQQLSLLYGVEMQRRKAQQQRSEERQRRINTLLLAVLIAVLAGAAFWFLLSRSRQQKKELMGKMEELRYQTNEHIMNSLTQQRKHIASDLHNNLGNMLATIRLSLSSMETYVRQWEDKYSETFFSATEQLDEACVTVRDMSRGMYTDKLNQFALLPALETLKDRLEKSGKLEVELDYAGMEVGVPNDLEVLIYQTFQELVTNSLKYSEASLLTLQLSSEEGEINLLFEDNGRGFDLEKHQTGAGIGLPNLREQIEAAGGKFLIDSQVGRGTTIIIDLPLSPNRPNFET